MPDFHEEVPRRAVSGRRDEDRVLRDRLRRYKKAFHVGQVLTSEMSRDALFDVIIHQSNEIMGAERSTVFVYDERDNELWSLVAIGMKKKEIRIPSDYGVAGWVFKHRMPVTVNNAYKDSRFYAEVDKKSGFKTKNIICVPLINFDNQCIGALQSLNKAEGDFTEEDGEMLAYVSNYVTIALENMKVYEELKSLNKARERAIHHLSHELKTPLALILAVFDWLAKESQKSGDTKSLKRIYRGQRNVNRLRSLQDKIDDILNSRFYEEKEKTIRIIQSAADFVEEHGEQISGPYAEALSQIQERIKSVYCVPDTVIEQLDLGQLLESSIDEAVSLMGARDLEITKGIGQDLVVASDGNVLKKVFGGLLRNAIENTPDGGKINIGAQEKDDAICVDFRDYGIGITPQNQKLIFGGFFHTQDTMIYSSRKPYEFGAGGSGSDLLRTRIFSERHRFSVTFSSSRCPFVPEDKNECPGVISLCPFVSAKSDCLSSGGSIFSVRFPKESERIF